MTRNSQAIPPFGGWNRRSPSIAGRSVPLPFHGIVEQAVGTFHSMPRVRRPEAAASHPTVSPASNRVDKTKPLTRLPWYHRDLFSLLRSRRHGRDRFLRYVLLPVLVIVTATGVFVLLRS